VANDDDYSVIEQRRGEAVCDGWCVMVMIPRQSKISGCLLLSEWSCFPSIVTDRVAVQPLQFAMLFGVINDVYE
jgi:hypothetical protein